MGIAGIERGEQLVSNVEAVVVYKGVDDAVAGCIAVGLYVVAQRVGVLRSRPRALLSFLGHDSGASVAILWVMVVLTILVMLGQAEWIKVKMTDSRLGWTVPP